MIIKTTDLPITELAHLLRAELASETGGKIDYLLSLAEQVGDDAAINTSSEQE